jgi:hypothetical protein
MLRRAACVRFTRLGSTRFVIFSTRNIADGVEMDLDRR